MKHFLNDSHKEHLRANGIAEPPDHIEIPDAEYKSHIAAWRNTNPSLSEEELHTLALGHSAWKRQAIPQVAEPIVPQVVEKGVIPSAPVGAVVAPEWDAWETELMWLVRIIALFVAIGVLLLAVRPAHGQFSHVTFIQFNQAGSPVTGGFFSYPFTINCNTGLTCSASGSTLTMNASGGGTGCNPPGTSGALLYDATGGACSDIADFVFDGSHTITMGASGVLTITAGGTINGITAGMIPTLNQNTTGSAAKWTTARNLAGNSVDGSANVAFSNKFIVQGTTDAGLSGAQFLGALSTGILKNTTTTGILSVATGADLPTAIPIGSVGSAGLSASSPLSIASTGAMSFSATTTSCTNQFVTAISAVAVGTCSTATLASAQFANQGTTTTVLHGNGAGNPSFAVVTPSDASGNTSGSGNFCLVTSCTMVTPALGTPASGVMTNLTGTPSAIGLTNETGLPLICGPGLGDGVNAIAAATYPILGCVNNSGKTWTVTGIRCFTDNAGSSTLDVKNNAGTSLLTGAVTCNATKTSGGAAGTQSATTTIASTDGLNFTFVADGTSKTTTWTVAFTQ